MKRVEGAVLVEQRKEEGQSDREAVVREGGPVVPLREAIL